MVLARDFLNADPTPGPSPKFDTLRMEASLDQIAAYLRRMNPDVLATAIVKGTSQVTNAITDLYSHEVVFQVGGKPVPIYQLLAFSTYTSQVNLSLLSLANAKDGVPVTTTPLLWNVATGSVHVRLSAITGSDCVVNGPAHATNGGLFLYGMTISDYDRTR
jgi:hypothetical protein